jgi:hypothetical protein
MDAAAGELQTRQEPNCVDWNISRV